MASHAITGTHLRQSASKEPTHLISPEQFLRRDQCLHLERDGIIYATDGRVAILNRVVVDQNAGEVIELVVTVEATGQMVVIPIDLVEKTGGSAIFLSIDRRHFSEQAGTAPAFEKRRFAKARARVLRKKGQQAAEQQRERAVAQVSRDHIETPVVTRLPETTATNNLQKP